MKSSASELGLTVQSCAVLKVAEMILSYDMKSTAQINNLVCKVTIESFFLFNSLIIMVLI